MSELAAKLFDLSSRRRLGGRPRGVSPRAGEDACVPAGADAGAT